MIRKPKESSKRKRPGVQRYAPSSEAVPAVKDIWLSCKERRVDALALRADERRDKLRKASGRSKYPLIRRSLNGETWLSNPQST